MFSEGFDLYKAGKQRIVHGLGILVLPAHFSESPEMKERFERETKSVAALTHPNILAIFDIGLSLIDLDPEMDHVRSKPRFKKVVRTLGSPARDRDPS